MKYLHDKYQRGFSLLELEVALLLLGITLTGVFPLLVVQSRGISAVEKHFRPEVDYYLVPSTNLWARKLGAAAALVDRDPGPPPTPVILDIDNGDIGYSETGSGWSTENASGAYNGDYRIHDSSLPASEDSKGKGKGKGKGLNKQGAAAPPGTAVWQFSNLTPGWYNVTATWPDAAANAPDAPYTIFDGSDSLGTYLVAQNVPPTGQFFGGRPWQSVAIAFFRNGAARVDLGSDAGGAVAADGVRLVPLINDVRIISLNENLTGDEATAVVSVAAPNMP
jgi:prepilin-type N-terminal cleavage/methylation domain-containing protein